MGLGKKRKSLGAFAPTGGWVERHTGLRVTKTHRMHPICFRIFTFCQISTANAAIQAGRISCIGTAGVETVCRTTLQARF